MQVETVKIASLTSDPANAKKHPARQIEELKRSLQRFGQQKPLVVDADGVVVAGNGTLEAARELGWKEIAIHRSALRGAEARAFALADNRIAELGEWDMEVLAEQFALPEIGPVGFDADELEKLICGSPPAAPAAEASTEPTGDSQPEAKSDQPPSGDAPVEKNWRGKGVWLTVDQRAGLDEVFARFRTRHEADGAKLSEGQILVLIGADWMAGN